MIDILEEKKTKRRNRILLAVLLGLLLAAVIVYLIGNSYAQSQTRDVRVFVKAYRMQEQDWVIYEVTNSYDKYFFVRCAEEIWDSKPSRLKGSSINSSFWSFAVQREDETYYYSTGGAVHHQVRDGIRVTTTECERRILSEKLRKKNR